MDKDRRGSPERFGYEWSTYSEILPESRSQLQRWLGSTSIESFKEKKVLDVGCGMGRNAYWMVNAGAAQLTAVDVDPGSLAAARKNLASYANAQVKECSVYVLDPRIIGTFDRVTCIGVLHHLSHPEDALQKMWSCVAPGGELILWCYGLEGNRLILPVIQSLRAVGSRLPLKATHLISNLIARGAWPAIRYLPWRTEYYKNIKNLSFKNVESIIFDQMIPKIANYWSRADMERLAKTLDGKALIESVQGNSWNVRITRQE